MKERGAARGIVVVLAIVGLALVIVGGLAWFRSRQLKLGASGGSSDTGMVVTALRGFPVDSSVFGGIANLTAYGEGFGKTAFGQMLKDPELRTKTRAAIAALGDSSGVEEMDQALASASELSDLGLRSLAFAVFPLTEASAPGATGAAATPGAPGAASLPEMGGAVVVACDDPAKVAAWLDAKLESAERSAAGLPGLPGMPALNAGSTGAATPATVPGEPATTATPGAAPAAEIASASPAQAPAAGTTPGLTVTTIVKGDIAGTPYVCREALCRAIRANTVIVGAPLEALRRMLEPSAGSPSPADTPRVRSALDAIHVAGDGLFVFVDLKRLVELTAKSLEAEPDSKKAFDAIGLGALESLAFTQRPEGAVFHDRGRMAYTAERAGVIGALLDAPPGAVTFDRAMPQSAAVVTAGRLPDLALLYDRAIGEVRKALPPPESAKLDLALAGLRGQLGIDLRNDVFAAFGGEWGIGYTPGALGSEGEDPAASAEQKALATLKGTRLVLALGVLAPDKVTSLLGRLDALATAQGVPLKVEPLADGQIRTIPLPIPGVPSPAIAYAKGRLVLGTPVEDVRTVAEGTSSLLGAEPAYGVLRDKLPKDATGVAYARSGGGAAFREFLAVAARGARSSADAPFAKTREALKNVSQAVESYRIESGVTPKANSIEELRAFLEPTYIAGPMPSTDAWGHPLGYASAAPGVFVVWSTGPDGVAEMSWSTCGRGCPEAKELKANPGADLVLANGVFVRGGEESQATATAKLDPALEELAADVNRRLAALPPSIAVVRSEPASAASAGLASLTYESLTAIETSTVPGLVGAVALPVWLGMPKGGAEPPPMGNEPQGGVLAPSPDGSAPSSTPGSGDGAPVEGSSR